MTLRKIRKGRISDSPVSISEGNERRILSACLTQMGEAIAAGRPAPLPSTRRRGFRRHRQRVDRVLIGRAGEKVELVAILAELSRHPRDVGRQPIRQARRSAVAAGRFRPCART
jgi:hypothetical protein